MSTVGYINISLEIWGSLLSLVILVCVALGGRERKAQKSLFIAILFCNIVILLCDAAAWGFKGRMDLPSQYVVRLANFLAYTAGYLLAGVFTSYLAGYIAGKTPFRKGPVYAAWILSGLGVVLVVVSQFNHMYYQIDGANLYHRESWFWLSQIWGIGCVAVDLWVLIKYRKSLSRREKVMLASYIVLPVLAMTVQIFIYGVALLNIATTVSIIMLYIGLQVEQARVLKEKELELAENRIAVMLSQIQPHFLFNTLTAIHRLCDINAERAKTAISEFSIYLRGNLDALSQKGLVPFEREMDHVKIYLSLEKMRFEEELTVAFDLQTTDFCLPPLTVQPLVENAVRCGVGKKEGGGTVSISTRENGDQIQVSICDDGVGFDKDAQIGDGRSHVGIQNVRARLRAQCGGSVAIESVPGVGTKAVISIPKGKAKDGHCCN